MRLFLQFAVERSNNVQAYSMNVPPFLADALGVLRDQYSNTPPAPSETSQPVLQPLASHISFLLCLSHEIPHPTSATYTQEAHFLWHLLMQKMYVRCDGQDTSHGLVQ